MAKLDGKVTFDDDNEVITDFTKAQEDALLKVVAEPFRMDDGEIEGGFAIIGIRALPNGHTLILYSVEFGDGSIKIIAIYDRNGNLLAYNELAYSIKIEDTFESSGNQKNRELYI